jgi:hypothetical protein
VQNQTLTADSHTEIAAGLVLKTEPKKCLKIILNVSVVASSKGSNPIQYEYIKVQFNIIRVAYRHVTVK